MGASNSTGASALKINIFRRIAAAAIKGDIMDDDDVRMAEGGGCLGLLDETLLTLGIRNAILGKDLDSDGPVEMGVDGLVDGTHAALADLFGDMIMEKCFADH
jgi:hypothetical protein